MKHIEFSQKGLYIWGQGARKLRQKHDIRLGKIETSLLRAHTNSRILWDPEQKQWFERSLGQTSLLTLKSLLERQEATAAHPGNVDTGSSHFGELVLPQRHWYLQISFWNPSSLFVLWHTSLSAPVLRQLRASSWPGGDTALPTNRRAALRPLNLQSSQD